MMKDKYDLGTGSEGTEEGTTTIEIETNQKNLKKGHVIKQLSEDKQTGTLNLDKSGARSIRQKKAPKSMSNDFLW
jgi:hypothetical protein